MPKNIRAASAVYVILAAALGLGYIGFRTARRAEACRSAVAKKRAALEGEMREREAMIAATNRERTTPGASPRESPWRVTASAGRPSPSPRIGTAAARSPTVLALSLAVFRSGLARKYRPLYQALGLSPSQIDAFETLLTSRLEERSDLNAVAAADGLDSGPEIAALQQQEDDNFRAEQIALLGEAGYQQLQEFNRVMTIWNYVVDGIGTGVPPDPLDETQAQHLVSILANASRLYQNGGTANLYSIDWNAALPQAQGILSGTQFEGLKAAIDGIELSRYGKQFFQREQGRQ